MSALSVGDPHAPRDLLATLDSPQAQPCPVLLQKAASLLTLCKAQRRPGGHDKLYPPCRRKVPYFMCCFRRNSTRPSKEEPGERGRKGMELKPSPHWRGYPRAQKTSERCWRMSFPAPASKRSKDVRCQENNAKASATPAQNVRQDCVYW